MCTPFSIKSCKHTCFTDQNCDYIFISLLIASDFSGGSDNKASAYNVGNPSSIPELGRSPEKEMAIHFSILTWRIPWTEEADGPKSWTRLSDFTFTFFS